MNLNNIEKFEGTRVIGITQEFLEEQANILKELKQECVQQINDMPHDDMLNISYEELSERVEEGMILYNSYERWDFYKLVEMVIPNKYKLLIFLNCVYVKDSYMSDECRVYFENLIKNESEESKLFRRELNNKALKSIAVTEGIELLDENGYAKIYRGAHIETNNHLGVYDTSRDAEHAISYTFNKVVAQWFAIRYQSDDCEVISASVHIDDILSINLDRSESEIMIKPLYLGGRLNDVKIDRIIPNIKIMKAFDKLRASYQED